MHDAWLLPVYREGTGHLVCLGGVCSKRQPTMHVSRREVRCLWWYDPMGSLKCLLTTCADTDIVVGTGSRV